MPDGLQLLSDGFMLTSKQKSLIIRIGWVTFVSFHILWVCGWLGFVGLQAPFAAAGDFKNLEAASNISASLNIAQEIRTQSALLCQTTAESMRNSIILTIDKLQLDYVKYSPTHQPYPLPRCPGT